MRSHCILISILLFIQLSLVNASLCIKSILVNIAFLVKLLIDVGCFHQITLNEALMNSSIKTNSTIPLSGSSIRSSHKPPLIHEILTLGNKSAQILFALLRWHNQARSSGCLLFIRCVHVVSNLFYPRLRLVRLGNLHLYRLNLPLTLLFHLLGWQWQFLLHLFRSLGLLSRFARYLALRLHRESRLVGGQR